MMRSTLEVYVLLGAIGVLGAIGDAALNKWAETDRVAWLLASYGFWIVVATLFGLVLKMERASFGSAVVLALLAHSIVAIVIDRVCFLGRLTIWEWIGMLFAIAAITCIEVGRTSARLELERASCTATEG